MAKKFKGEDGHTYVEKKPFYKRVWFWILAVIVFIFILGGIGSSSGSGDKSSSSKSGATSSTSSKKPENKVNEANFNRITISSSTGTSVNDVQNMFSKKPDSSDESNVEDEKTNMLTWDNVADTDMGSIIVWFENNHAVMKSISDLHVKRSKKITLAQFNAIKNGTSKEDIQRQFGKPNGYTYNSVEGLASETWDYTTGVKGDLGANFSIDFDNSGVTGKTQTSMQ